MGDRQPESRIEAIECIPVTVPIEAPILTSYGSLAAYARTVVRVHTEDGRTGWGEASARVRPDTVRTFLPSLRGLDVFETTLLSHRIRNWNYYPWQKAEPLIAAIEMACLDIQGKILDLPLYRLLGGRLRDTVPVAGYVFYRHANADGTGRVHEIEEVVDYARRVVERHGFAALKLKGGYFPPERDRDALEALRDSFGRDMGLRIDPQASWTVATAVRIGRQLERIGVEYYEDPVWGAASMAQVRKDVRIPFATNMCVTEFDQLYPAVRLGAADVILADLWYWGGIRPCLALERMCATMGLDVGMHSGGELGIAWAAMLHAAAAMPNLRLGIDFMNMHLLDDILLGPRQMPEGGEIAPPEGPGLGIGVDEEKLERYAALAASGSADDRFVNPALADQARPGWYPKMPAW